MLRGGVPVEPREFRHMAMEKQENPKFQSPDKLSKHREWPDFVAIAGMPSCGRTEWLMSLASALAEADAPAYLSDLTEERSFLCDRAFAVYIKRTMPDVYALVPKGDSCDAAHVKPEIEWAVARRRGRVLLDVGTNAPGLLVLGSFKNVFLERGYDFHLLVNPFAAKTADVHNIRALKLYAEALSGIPVTNLIANAYCGGRDEPRDCARGALEIFEVSQALGLPLLYTLAPEEIAESVGKLLPEELPVWSLKRVLRREDGETASVRRE